MQILTTNFKITAFISIVATTFLSRFGNLRIEVQTLLVFMAIDYIMGFLLAIYFKNSNKTDTGAYSSSAGFKGLAKKCVTLLFLVILCYLDKVMGTTYITTLGTVAFIVNELASIVENAGLMGIKIPKVVEDVMDVLKNKDK